MIHSLEDKIELNNGVTVPGIGLGVYSKHPQKGETYNAVLWAIEAGYRHVDTASFYHNEDEVGLALRDSGIAREEIFVTTKLWPTDYSKTREAFEESLEKLRLSYLDMYMLHWPGVDLKLRYAAWETLQKLIEKKLIRAAGVSNFLPHHLKDLKEKLQGVPAMNQIELHPWHQQRETVDYCKKNGIVVTAWGPIFHGHLSEEPLMEDIAARYGVSAAQVTLRWHLQKGNVIIPKSAKKERIVQNAELFHFELAQEDMEKIDALDGKHMFAFDAETFDGILDDQ